LLDNADMVDCLFFSGMQVGCRLFGGFSAIFSSTAHLSIHVHIQHPHFIKNAAEFCRGVKKAIHYITIDIRFSVNGYG